MKQTEFRSAHTLIRPDLEPGELHRCICGARYVPSEKLKTCPGCGKAPDRKRRQRR